MNTDDKKTPKGGPRGNVLLPQAILADLLPAIQDARHYRHEYIVGPYRIDETGAAAELPVHVYMPGEDGVAFKYTLHLTLEERR